LDENFLLGVIPENPLVSGASIIATFRTNAPRRREMLESVERIAFTKKDKKIIEALEGSLKKSRLLVEE
jgi:hypothetical protein